MHLKICIHTLWKKKKAKSSTKMPQQPTTDQPFCRPMPLWYRKTTGQRSNPGRLGIAVLQHQQASPISSSTPPFARPRPLPSLLFPRDAALFGLFIALLVAALLGTFGHRNPTLANDKAVQPGEIAPPASSNTSTMATTSIARVFADVNVNMPRSYWDYDSVNISWGVLENYEVVRKIGMLL